MIDIVWHTASNGAEALAACMKKPMGAKKDHSTAAKEPADPNLELNSAQEALRVSEARYRSLAEYIPSVLMRFDRHYRAVYLSPGSDEYTAIPASEILGKSNREIGMPTHLCDLWENAMETVFQTGRPTDGEFEFETPNGPRTFLLRLAPEYSADGKQVEYVLGVSTDITDRKRAEEALRDSMERYRMLFDTTSDGVWIHNLDGCILEVNDAYCRMSGYSREEILGMPISVLEAVETPEDIAQHIKKVIDSGGHDRFESAHRRKDGSIFDVDITALYLERDGGRIAIFVRDITDRKSYEQKRQALYEREHRTAEMLQEAIIPGQGVFCFPGVEVGTRYKAALQESLVGGDFYDVFELGEGKIGVLIGDVAGKGLLAAMQVSAARFTIRSYAYLDPRPARVMALANETLLQGSEDGSGMLTAFFAVVDAGSGIVTYSCAGHEPPILRRRRGAERCSN